MRLVMECPRRSGRCGRPLPGNYPERARSDGELVSIVAREVDGGHLRGGVARSDLRRDRTAAVRRESPDVLINAVYRPMSLARHLGFSRDTIRGWLRAGWLNLRRDDDGHHVIWADAGELRRLRELHDLPRTWANKTRLAKLKKPKP